jgi:hypothetical protein
MRQPAYRALGIEAPHDEEDELGGEHGCNVDRDGGAGVSLAWWWILLVGCAGAPAASPGPARRASLPITCHRQPAEATPTSKHSSHRGPVAGSAVLLLVGSAAWGLSSARAAAPLRRGAGATPAGGPGPQRPARPGSWPQLADPSSWPELAGTTGEAPLLRPKAGQGAPQRGKSPSHRSPERCQPAGGPAGAAAACRPAAGAPAAARRLVPCLGPAIQCQVVHKLPRAEEDFRGRSRVARSSAGMVAADNSR